MSSSIGTFGTFTTARLGIYVAQKGLAVTGNNISNINTDRYTRQRLDQVSFKTGGSDRYASRLEVQVGHGALATSVSQLRDPYLDIRYRTEMSKVGFMSEKLSNLNDLADVIDEVGKGTGENEGDGVMQLQFNQFLKALENLSNDSGADANDSLVRASADALTQLFHSYANELETLQKNATNGYKQDINKVNEMLNSIRDLNAAIRKSEIHGDNALEMRDERNRLIDDLSEYLKIDVVYSMEDLGSGIQVEKLTIKLGNANPDPTKTTDTATLVDGIYSVQLVMPKANPEYEAICDSTSDEYLKAIKGFNVAAPDGPVPYEFNGIEYTKKEDLDAAIAAYLDLENHPENAIKTFRYLDENGEGTNDPMDALQEPNENCDLMLTKLKDVNGEDWKGINTSIKEIEDTWSAKAAKYTMELTGTSGWADGDTIDLGNGITISIKDDGTGDITSASANNAYGLVKVVAEKLNDAYPDYTVKTSGRKLIFTANTEGEIGKSGPAVEPDQLVNINNPIASTGPDDPGRTQTLTFGTKTETVKGREEDPNFKLREEFTLTDEETGAETGKIVIIRKEINDQWYEITATTKYTFETELHDNDLGGSIQARREMLTEEGEFSSAADIERDPNAAIKRGIPYYRQSLDLLARKFAEEFNKLNTGYAVDQNGNYLTNVGTKDEPQYEVMPPITIKVDADGKYDPTGATEVTLQIGTNMTDLEKQNLDTYLKDNQYKDVNDYLEKNDGALLGGNLFSVRGDLNETEITDADGNVTGINASNISVSKDWANRDLHIVTTFTKLFGGDVENTTDNKNVDRMVTLMDKKLTFNPQSILDDAESSQLFLGSFQEMLNNMCTVLGSDQSSTTTELSTYSQTALEIDTSRDGVSGVDLNDEAMNLMQYSKALNAAYRLMTTIDEALDRLINNTGVVGR